MTNLKGVSSMKLHCDLGVIQKAAWFMLHRIREAMAGNGRRSLGGPVEVNETYFGGKRKNMSNAKRAELKEQGLSQGPKGKGPFHRLSVKHLQRYLDEFVARHKLRVLDTLDQMAHVAAGMVGRRLMYRDLVADNGRAAVAR